MNFAGPLFLVGHSRSGTQLLRTLLNRHKQIAIVTNESKFIPAVMERFGPPSRLSDPAKIHDFYQFFSDTTFYRRLREKGFALSEEELMRLSDPSSWESFFEVIFRFYAPSAGKKAESFIWGDKSPRYLKELESFTTCFPNSKFIHIIRDPRDVCLSHKKRWRTPCELTAAKWQARVGESRQVGASLGAQRYRELRYEDLLLDTESVIRSLCDFLGVGFHPDMTRLAEPVSDYQDGDAGLAQKIVTINREKWREAMGRSELKRVEEIAYSQLVNLGYAITLAHEANPLSEKRKMRIEKRARLLNRLPERIARRWV
ncbi:sulfotransferase [Halioglobus sp.]|nr:sulfotransferase [Halioglobus sp.]